MNRIFPVGVAAMLALLSTGAAAQLAGSTGSTVGATVSGTTGSLSSTGAANNVSAGSGAGVAANAAIGDTRIDASAGAGTDLKRATRKSRRGPASADVPDAAVQAGAHAQTPGGGF